MSEMLSGSNFRRFSTKSTVEERDTLVALVVETLSENLSIWIVIRVLRIDRQ